MKFKISNLKYRIGFVALPVFLGAILVLLICAGLQGNVIRAAPLALRQPGLLAAPGDVVINEVAWGATAASSYDEWMELYNNTGNAIDLTGWRLAASCPLRITPLLLAQFESVSVARGSIRSKL